MASPDAISPRGANPPLRSRRSEERLMTGTRRCLCLAIVLAAACEEDQPHPPEAETVVRRWTFHTATSLEERQLGSEEVQVGGAVHDTEAFGNLLLNPIGEDAVANGEVFSSATGGTYWVGAEAPHGRVAFPGDVLGSSTRLTQYQRFRKTDAAASLSLVVSQTLLRAIDGNPGDPLPIECPWHQPGSFLFADCIRIMRSWIDVRVWAFSLTDLEEFFSTGGFAELSGWNDAWDYDVHTHADVTAPFWRDDRFSLDEDGGIVDLKLSHPLLIEVPLDSIATGDTFLLATIVTAGTHNRRQRESYLSAWFRDPQGSDGLSFSHAGLEPVETPSDAPSPAAAAAAPPCPTGPDPQAGTIEFSSAAFSHPELPGGGATVVVRRTGGSRGAVSALLTTADGDALAGSDYGEVATLVLFADGEEGERGLRVPMVLDGVAEPDEDVELALSAPMGCVALGAQATATLTILDDDRPLEEPTYTVGGNVTGLAGTGMLLREVTSGFELTPTNGPFTFSYRFPDGRPYEVRVVSQPVNPIQECSVINAAGTIASADVTDVAVACVTQEPESGLDLTFGSGGKVTEGLPGGAVAMALQPDGKVLVLGERRLARYTALGTPDLDFGAGGSVDVELGGTQSEAHGLALQPDGKVVVVGTTRVGTNFDFGVARYDEAGELDPDFGADGKTTTDFHGNVDRAHAVLVQPDGGIVVAGHAATTGPLGVDNDFAVARYTSGGEPDLGFGAGGKVTTDIGGRADLAYAAALQPDGKVLVAGRVAIDGGADPDVGMVRYTAGGAPDPDFGAQGISRTSLSSWDEASDVVLQADGRSLVSVKALVGTTFQFMVARFESGGGLDGSFGSGGVATAGFSAQHDYAAALALQADGKIVVVGQASNLMTPDFALARFDGGGTLDPDFGDGGKLTIDFFGAGDGAECVGVQPDGKILVGGVATSGTTVGLGLARILP
jgi:uncharacterized delta-60 repeat protein